MSNLTEQLTFLKQQEWIGFDPFGSSRNPVFSSV